MRRWSVIRTGIAAAALISAGLLVQAQGPGTGSGPGFGMHRPPMERAMGPMGEHFRWWNNPETVEKLKLTDEQRKAMDQILLQHREQLIDMRAGVEKAELGLEPLMHADQPEEGKILSQIDKVAQARAELEKANARFLLALRAKLSPDQWKQLQALRNERMDHMGREMRHNTPNHNAPDHMPAPAPPPAGVPQGMMQQAPNPDMSMPVPPEPLVAENTAAQ